MQATFDSRIETLEHISEVRGLLNEVVKDLIDRAHVHDESKLHSPEVEVFDKVTPRLRELTVGSEEYEKIRAEMGPAVLHHYSQYRHHPEHHARGIRGMNLIDLVEMVCDWIAAAKRHDDGDVRRSLDDLQDRFRYSDELKEIMLNTINALEPETA